MSSQRQKSHIPLGFGREGSCLYFIRTVSRFHPGKNLIGDHISGVMGKLGTGAFQMGEIVLDIGVINSEFFRETVSESVLNHSIAIIHWKVTEQVSFDIINGIQMHEIHPNGVAEIFQIKKISQMTCIRHCGNYIGFAGIQIAFKVCGQLNGKLYSECFDSVVV